MNYGIFRFHSFDATKPKILYGNKRDIFERKCTFKYPKGFKDTKYVKTTGVVPSLIF